MARPRKTETADGAGDKGPTQIEMVRLSLEELGAKAKPQALTEHIKTKFGKDLATTVISNYKSVLKRKGEIPGGAKPAKAAGGSGGSGGIRVEDLEAVRGLVDRIGADNLRKLVDVFGR